MTRTPKENVTYNTSLVELAKARAKYDSEAALRNLPGYGGERLKAAWRNFKLAALHFPSTWLDATADYPDAEIVDPHGLHYGEDCKVCS